MARLIVWAKRDNSRPDPKVDAQLYKPGMVVDVLPDGKSPGTAVEKSPWWRIVEVPGDPSEYAYLLAHDRRPDDPRTMDALAVFPRKRVTQIDLDAIERAAGILVAGSEPERVIGLASKLAIAAQEASVTAIENPQVFVPIEA